MVLCAVSLVMDFAFSIEEKREQSHAAASLLQFMWRQHLKAKRTGTTQPSQDDLYEMRKKVKSFVKARQLRHCFFLAFTPPLFSLISCIVERPPHRILRATTPFLRVA